MIEITVTVENDSSDTGFESLLRNELADFSGLLLLGACLHAEGGCGAQCGAGEVVDDLNIDLLVAAEHRHAGALGSTGDLVANSILNLDSSFYFRCHDYAILKLLIT